MKAAVYDGDTPRAERPLIRKNANLVMTNPDMLHLALLPDHARWADFFFRLSLVVVDEAHVCRGVFGSHVAMVLRRLRRLVAHYGGTPRWMLASATIGNPGELATRLTGPAVRRGRGRRRAARARSCSRCGTRRSSTRTRDAAERAHRGVVADVDSWSRSDIRTIGFMPVAAGRRAAGGVRPARRRRRAEAREDQVVPSRLPGGGSPQARAGAGERRAARDRVDERARAGHRHRLARRRRARPATRARARRCGSRPGGPGRRDADSLAMLVAQDDPLDQYLVHHPEDLFDKPPEAAVIDPTNPYVLEPHLRCAARELPLARGGAGVLRRRAPTCAARSSAWSSAKSWCGAGTPGTTADGSRPTARWTSGPAPDTSTRIVDRRDRRAAGHRRRASRVLLAASRRRLPPPGRAVPGRRTGPGVRASRSCTAPIRTTTRSRATSPTSRWSTSAIRARTGDVDAFFGTVRVTNQVVSYVRKLVSTNDVIDEIPLPLPPQHLETKAVWWTIPPDRGRPGGGLARAPSRARVHAAEHAAIGLLPLVATCDRWDVGGVSTPLHPDTGLCTIFIYDGYPGGAGIAERGFRTRGPLARGDARGGHASARARGGARPASSRRSAATATSRSTSRARRRCWRRSSATDGELRPPGYDRAAPRARGRACAMWNRSWPAIMRKARS